ncbi:histidine phosphatase family protein [Paenibacillus sp. NPDC093718]|uniref:histidine phosphatase family protein n=1 Tax=Paenibacillus sp. NPDC093718 TaxID=3390601 RepID=UPI003D04B780
MKIGLVRHFKVIHKLDREWMTSDQFNAWVEAYNNAEIEQPYLDCDYSEWTVCLSSDLPRVVQTAETIYPGPIIATNRLREIEVQSIHPLGNLKLHYYMWLLMGRLAWYLSHRSQVERRSETLKRAGYIIDWIEEHYRDRNVLVVSHGAFMKVLTQVLHKRSYRGKGFVQPRNGAMYIFEK